MIPKLNISNALSVYDGSEIVGFVAHHERSFFSYDRNHVLLGEYRSQGEAMKAIPKVMKEGIDER